MDNPMGDHELLEKYTKHDSEDAFRTLVERYSPLVFGVCNRMLKDRCDASEAAQAVFVALALKAGKLIARNGLAPWLHTVSRTIAIDVLRKNQRRQAKHEEFMANASSDSGAHDHCELENAIQRLPLRLRTAVLQHYFLGQSLEEIAQLEAVSTSAIAMRLNRAREVLRKRLAHIASPVTALLLICRATPSADAAFVAKATYVAQSAVRGSTLTKIAPVAVDVLRRWMWRRLAWASSALVAVSIAVIPFLVQLTVHAEKVAADPHTPKLVVVSPITDERKKDPVKLIVAEHPLVALLQREHGIDLEFQRVLAANRDDLNSIRNSSGQGLLHIVAERAYWNEALLLLRAGADPNVKDALGKTPLHYAVTDSRMERAAVRDLLIISGARVGEQDDNGKTPLIDAIEGKANRATIEYLLWIGEPLKVPGLPPDRQPEALAQRRGDQGIIELLSLAANGNAEVPVARSSRRLPKYLHSSFTRAAELGDLAALDTLIVSGANINALDEDGHTALSKAAAKERFDVVMYLLMLGADPNISDADGVTPLAAANYVLGTSSDYCRLLLIAAGANPKYELKNGRSILVDAALREHEHAMQWLIWAGVNPNASSKAGTPMHVASKEGKLRAVERLRMNGVKESPFLSMDPAWLMLAAVRGGKTAEIDKLLATGVAVDLPLEKGDNALIHAIHARRIDVARHLLQKGSNPNYRNPENGGTPLHASTSWLYYEIEQFRKELLEAGADPNLPDKAGVTPMMAACRSGDLNPKVIQMLDFGGNLTLRDVKGLSAIDHARNSGLPDVPKYLESVVHTDWRKKLQNIRSSLVGRWQSDRNIVKYSSDGRMSYYQDDRLVYNGGWDVGGDRLWITMDPQDGGERREYAFVELEKNSYACVFMNEWGLSRYMRISDQ